MTEMYVILVKTGWIWLGIVTVLFLAARLVQGMQKKRTKRAPVQHPSPPRTPDQSKQ